MKAFAIALTVLGVAAGAAQADTFRDTMDRQRHDTVPVARNAEYSVRVPAGDILSNKDLVNSLLSAGDLVTVTQIPSSGVIDTGK